AMEFVVYFAQLYGYALADAEKKSWRLLEEVGLQNRANSPIGRYSRGMRQRLGIARAFINDPLVVFLDEPTLGLDPRGQKELLLFVRKLAKERNTGVILCSHFLSEIEDFCDEVVILNSGSVVAKGPVDKVIGQVYDQAPRMHQVRVRVSPARIQDAWQRLEGLREVANVATEGERAGWLRVELANSDDAHTEENHPIGNRILETLIRSEIPILDFETGTGRLENALLWLTAARRE
ncbi:MAG: ABC transporter ATP-binding protein, partial [Calditrichaeota bacterium]